MPAVKPKPAVRKPGNNKALSVVPLIVAGFVAFVGGAWFFMPKTDPVEDDAPPTPPTPAAPAPAKPTIPEKNTRLTWTNFEKIRSGMTEDQVRKVLGDPTDGYIKTDKNDVEMCRVFRWEQLTPPIHIEVNFANGKSTERTTNIAPEEMDLPFTKFTSM